MNYDPDLEPIIADLKKADEDLAEGLADHSRAISELTIAIQQLGDRVTEMANTPIAPPPVQIPATSPVQPPTSWVSKFPGDVESGKIRWGCSHQSNGVPSSHETAAGVAVGVRRTFWRMTNTNSLISTARADISAGRVPWVSVKLGMSWEDVASGRLDAQLSVLFKNLASLPGPVWFTAHHEPEGGGGSINGGPDDIGGPTQWRAMQTRVRQVLDASGAKNIAFAPILMAWTFDKRSGRNPADWWVPGIWDFAGIDHYIDASATSMLTPMWAATRAFYDAKGLRIAIGEWGNKDHGPSGAREMQEWYEHLISINSPGVCYFDTSLNGGVPLSGEALVKFRELMQAATSVRL
jgi:hypothetical protein